MNADDGYRWCWEYDAARAAECTWCGPSLDGIADREEIPRKQVADLIRAIDAGTVAVRFEPLTPKEPTPRSVYCGTCRYKTADGWVIDVFNDCDSFDYIEQVEAPDGRVTDAAWLMEYRPDSEEKSLRIWGLP